MTAVGKKRWPVRAAVSLAILIALIAGAFLLISGNLNKTKAFLLFQTNETSVVSLISDLGSVPALELGKFDRQKMPEGFVPAAIVRSDGSRIDLTATKRSPTFETAAAGDRICNTAGACHLAAEATYLGGIAGPDGVLSWTPNLFFWPAFTDFGSIRFLNSSGGGKLFAVANDGSSSVAFDLRPGTNDVDFKPLQWRSRERIIYAAMAAVIVGVLAFVAGAYLAGGPVRIAILGAASTILILALAYWPGIFAHDFLFSTFYGDAFNPWYSNAYQIFSNLMGVIGFDFYIGAALALWLIILCLLGETYRTFSGRSALWVLLAAMLLVSLNPAFHLVVAGVQRYFTVVSFAFLSIGLAYVSLSVQSRTWWLAIFAVQSISIGIAIAMRLEYAVLLVPIAIATFASGARFFRALPRASLAGAGILVAVALAGSLESRIVPRLFGLSDSFLDLMQTRYKTASALEMVRSGAACPDSAGKAIPEVRQYIEALGSPERYCGGSAEVFFWDEAHAKLGELLGRDLKRFENLENQAVSQTLSKDFAGYLEQRVSFASKMMSQPYWHLEATPRPETVIGPHQTQAARYFRYEDTWNDGFARTLAGFELSLSRLGPGFSLICFLVMVVIYPIAFLRAPLTFLFNVAFVLATVGVMLVAPTLNWAYAVFVPVWVFLAPFYAYAERKSRKEESRTAWRSLISSSAQAQ